MLHHVLLRLSGELSAKGRSTRRRFVDRLAHNLADALAGQGAERPPLEARIERRWSRLVLVADAAENTDDPECGERLAARARTVSGVREAIVATRIEWTTLDELLERAAAILRPAVAARTFAVRARRGETATALDLRTPDLERRLGALLVPGAAGVDLETPRVEVRLEIDDGSALAWSETDESSALGPGGLPVGTEGRALVLFSGGFDSPVAAWRMLRRGVRVDYLVGILGDDAQRDAVLEVARPLADWSWGYRPRLSLVDLRPLVAALRAACPPALWQIVLKRQLLRVAEPLALRRRAGALVTGEVIGQVSSQTLPNLAVIERAVDLPVLRPLLTAEKHDILAEARRLGSHDASARVPELCALDAPRPETAATLEALEAAEAALDPELPARLADARVELDLRAWASTPRAARARSAHRALAVDRLEDAAGRIVLDLRRDTLRRALPVDGSLALDYPAVLDALDTFDPAARYVAVCEIGVKSADLAARLAARGVDACHVRGGLRGRPGGGAVDPALAAALAPAVRD